MLQYLAGEPHKQKRKKLKISKASASGSRVVFDEEGRAQDPLAQLSLPGDSRCGGSFSLLQSSFCLAMLVWLRLLVKAGGCPDLAIRTAQAAQ